MEDDAKKKSPGYISGAIQPQEGDMLLYNPKTGKCEGQEWFFYQGKWTLPPDLPPDHFAFLPF